VEQIGGTALYWPGDVSDFIQMKHLVDLTVRQLGGIDIVVNCGGVRTNGSITDITEADWDRTLDVNLKGAFVVSRLAIPEMINEAVVSFST
jgi:NAD(P)-dependent dehydrogenase (short-subunit alcohol dehydrogenase family)